MKEYLPINSERVSIRECNVSDARMFVNLYRDENIRKHIGRTIDITEDKIREKIFNEHEFVKYTYVLEKLSNSRSLGYIRLVFNAELGGHEVIMAIYPQYQDKGFGREAMASFLYVWLKIHKALYARCSPENKRPIRLLNALGFVKINQYKDFFNQEYLVYRINGNST